MCAHWFQPENAIHGVVSDRARETRRKLGDLQCAGSNRRSPAENHGKISAPLVCLFPAWQHWSIGKTGNFRTPFGLRFALMPRFDFEKFWLVALILSHMRSLFLNRAHHTAFLTVTCFYMCYFSIRLCTTRFAHLFVDKIFLCSIEWGLRNPISHNPMIDTSGGRISFLFYTCANCSHIHVYVE